MKPSNFPITLAVLFALSMLAIAPLSTPALCADSPAIAKVLAAAPAAEVGTATNCAVCGMKIHVKSDTPGAEYAGKDYYFCDTSERDAFIAKPEMYLHKAAAQ
jgi:YHS domain-containing protein